eukprot:TRINITY_DN23749_c0_g1_i1.p2 TRINITY_DN23749_c0_g1~~TRINITY_DN23749_c0_g1_i1.p2  ORF type:complete len:133 (+),score=33.95 TRINITY_DN23749_c0_g1_i1:272-670(+)
MALFRSAVLVLSTAVVLAAESIDSAHGHLRATSQLASHLHGLDQRIHDEMRQMMALDEDADLLRTGHASEGESASDEEYERESAAALSAALGPRWDAKRLDEDAERSTQALLHSISGPRTVGAIRGIMSAFR